MVEMSGRACLCFYTHSANGRIFYVGSGSVRRLYDRHMRTPRWKEHVENVGAFDTAIFVWTDDRAEAQQIEAELIAAHKPVCNVKKIDRRSKYPALVQAYGEIQTAL
jgi:hypothetical protein